MSSKSKVYECIFCNEITSGSANIFYKSPDGIFIARWDQFPVTPGHVEIMPTRHEQYFDGLTKAERDGLMEVVGVVTKIIETTDLESVYQKMLETPVNDIADAMCQSVLTKLKDFKKTPDAYNHGLNDGPAAGQTISHFHYHIMPRWAGDMPNPRGGIRHMFLGKGNYTTYALAPIPL